MIKSFQQFINEAKKAKTDLFVPRGLEQRKYKKEELERKELEEIFKKAENNIAIDGYTLDFSNFSIPIELPDNL